MTTKDRCGIAFLAFLFIDTSNQDGVITVHEILDSLEVSFETFKDYMISLPRNENTRFEVYKDLRNLSSEDKGIIRNIVFNAYSKGGKQGTDYAIFYLKEMIKHCDLANAYITL